ncbi:MAG: hypothetical protein OEL83_10355 [Desulforhopalus sp.]|nr:hypothetical protein [Desulforhopalus sp.]
MKNNQFKRPLQQSAAVLAGVIILASIAASSGTGGVGGSILAILSAIGNSILFVIGMTVSLGICIATLIAIFLGAVAMVSPDQAGQMYADLKKNFAQIALTSCNAWACCDKDHSAATIDVEVYNRMKQEINHLQESNSKLNGKITELEGEALLFQEKIEGLSTAIHELQASETAIKEVVAGLTAKIQSGSDQEMIGQIAKLEVLQNQTRKDIDGLVVRLAALEQSQKASSTAGILAYIDNDRDKDLFRSTVDEAINQEMTYTQIDDYLTSKLPTALDKTIKSHPSLTKAYIRNIRG